MTTFSRSGHWRTNQYGNTHWVQEHDVTREIFNTHASALKFFGNKKNAVTFLSRHAANYKRTTCFVEPNARCPVCGEPVFFYSNMNGSKVFFDDLGPPWPKHPCTDNSNLSLSKLKSNNNIPKIRSIYLRQQLFLAQSFISNNFNLNYGERREGEWCPAIITMVHRVGEKNTIIAEYLETIHGEKFKFECYSTNNFFKQNDIIIVRGNSISHLNRDTLKPVFFKDGSRIESISFLQNNIDKQSIISSQESKLGQKTSSINSSVQNIFIRHCELEYFHSVRTGIHVLIPNVYDNIVTLNSIELNDPIKISEKLNKLKIKTANHKKWTPYTASILVKIVTFFNIKAQEIAFKNSTKSFNLEDLFSGKLSKKDVYFILLNINDAFLIN